MRSLLLILLLCAFYVFSAFAQSNANTEWGNHPWLKRQLQALGTGKNKIKVAEMLGKVCAKNKNLISPELLTALSTALENDPDNAVKEAAGKALLAIGTEPAIAKLTDVFKNSNPTTRLTALKILLDGKKAERPLILAAAKDPDPEIRMTIASACSICSADDVELLNAIADLADKDPDPDVRKEAIKTLIALEVAQEDDGLSTPAVIPKEIKECLEAIASSKDKKIKQAAVDKLIAMGKTTVQPAIWELLDITAHEDPDARYYTAMALKGIGDKTAICGLKSGIYYEEVPYVRSMMEDALKHLQSLPD